MEVTPVNARRPLAPLAVTLFLMPLAAFAQPLTPPRLEIDFSGGSIPLSPMLSVLIAIAVAAVGIVALRKMPRRGTLPLIGALIVAAGALALSTGGVRLMGRAQAALPTTQLTLGASPTVINTTFLGNMTVINGLSTPITIAAVTYDTGSYDYYVDAANTTCVTGVTLLPGGTCVIRILSLG
jgi:hypothetical protein